MTDFTDDANVGGHYLVTIEGNLIKVAVIDDDVRLRTHLLETINTSPTLECIWSAESLKQARAHLNDLPDIALVDLGLPDGDGADLISEFQNLGETKVLVITVFDDRQSVLKCIHSGADGYLVKDSSTSEIVAAIDALMDGGSPISATAAIHLIEMVRPAPQSHTAPEKDHVKLTPRETELLEVFAKGFSYQEVADILNISRHTVGDHMKSIYRKLAVHSRSEAIYEARQQRIIDV